MVQGVHNQFETSEDSVKISGYNPSSNMPLATIPTNLSGCFIASYFFYAVCVSQRQKSDYRMTINYVA